MRSLAVAIAIVLVGAAPAAAGTRDQQSLSSLIESTCSAFSGDASVVVSDPLTGYRYSRSADRVFPSASLFKLAVMVEAYRADAAGTISLDDTTVTIEDEDIADDGSFTDEGAVLTVREAIERMITISDNAPARALLRLLDARRVNATMAALGMPNTRINWVLPEAEQTMPFNTTTARDMERLFVGLYRGAVVGPAQSAEMLSILKRQRINDRLPAGLPDGAIIAHKTGNLPGFAHDAGIIYTPLGPRIAVVLTSDYDQYDDVVSLNEQIASLTYAAKLDAFAARYQVKESPSSVVAAHPQALLRWTVQVTNASSFPWTADTYLTETLYAAATPTRNTDLGQVELPALAPGASAAITVNVVAPESAGPYVLEIQVADKTLGSSGNRFPIVFQVASD